MGQQVVISSPEFLPKNSPVLNLSVVQQHIHASSGPLMAVSLVRNLLRYPDQVRTVLEVTQITNESTAQYSQGGHAKSRNRRVLAVISHKDDWSPTEEGW
jgi:hypothetical protein